jgi:phage terminase large subunit-like protein
VSNKWLRRQLRLVGNQAKPTEFVPLIEWIKQKCPDLEPFEYFRQYAEALERAIGGDLRLAFAAPPQHGKTLLTLLALLWLCTFFPGHQHAYVTFNSDRTQEVAKDFKRLAEQLDIELSGTLDIFELPGGSRIKFTSVRGGLTGFKVDGLCVVDDPFKDAKEARSPTARRDVVEWWKSVARTRRHPGTSYIVMATRWHTDDLTGYLVKQEGWQYLNFKAIAEPANDNDVDAEGRVKSDPLRRKPGQSLCPARKPPEFFAEERKDKYWWYAMYQGEPMPLGGEVFRAPTYYRPDQLPVRGFRIAYGVDLSYSKKTSADFSVCIEVWAVVDPKLKDDKGKPIVWFYVVEVQRKQVDAPSFTLTLKAKQAERPAKFFWYASGTEKGSADFIRAKGIPIVVLDPHGRDKLMRAQRTAALWNMGRIMVPLADGDEDGNSSIPWVAPFVEEVCSFTGVSDTHDDQVDALVPAIDMLERGFATGTVQRIPFSDR